MSGTSKVLPALHSIKSLPPKFKITTGNPTSGLMENHGVAKLRSSDVIGSGSPENDALIGEVAEEARDCVADVGVYDEDLVYSRKCVSLEDRPSIADEDLESVPLSFPSISISSGERRWSDTTPYASKKVLLATNFNLISCWILKVLKDIVIYLFSCINNLIFLEECSRRCCIFLNSFYFEVWSLAIKVLSGFVAGYYLYCLLLLLLLFCGLDSSLCYVCLSDIVIQWGLS